MTFGRTCLCVEALRPSIVRPVLRYVVLLIIAQLTDSKRLERVQRKCLRFKSYTLKIPCPPHSYGPLANIRTRSI